MSVCGQFFELLDGMTETEKAFEAPEDVAAAAVDDVDALDEAVSEVEPSTESDDQTSETEEETLDEDEGSSNEELSEEEPAEPDSADLEDEYEDIPEEPSDVQEDYTKRLNVFKNTQQLLDIVIQNKETFEARFGKGLTVDLAKDYRLITKNFDDFITVARTTLAEKYGSGSYNTLVKYHVSLTKVYDIIIRMTENFVKKYNEEIEN